MIRIPYGPDPLHFGELRLPAGPGPHPVVVVIHGGGWQSGVDLDYMRPVAVDLTGRGLATWIIEYRRRGDPGGGWSGTLEDVLRAASHVRELGREYPLDLSRLVALGHSSGGHLALWLGAQALHPGMGGGVIPLAGVVSLAGISDLRDAWAYQRQWGRAPMVAAFLGGDPDEVPDRYALASPVEQLPLGVAQVLVHGDRDEAVPIEQSRRYVEKAREAGDPVRLLELTGANHLAVVDTAQPHWAAIAGAVQDLTRRDSE